MKIWNIILTIDIGDIEDSTFLKLQLYHEHGWSKNGCFLPFIYEYVLQKINFDPTFFQEQLSKIKMYYLTHYLPSILGRRL